MHSAIESRTIKKKIKNQSKNARIRFVFSLGTLAGSGRAWYAMVQAI